MSRILTKFSIEKVQAPVKYHVKVNDTYVGVISKADDGYDVYFYNSPLSITDLRLIVQYADENNLH